MPSLHTLYQRLPYPLRVAMASTKGYSLRRWRYGPETDRLIADIHSREKWSAEQWRSWQAERLSLVLERAVKEVPYYRDYWREHSTPGDSEPWRNLANWPILKKDVVRSNSRAFVSEACSIWKMATNETSGTTGTPVSFYRTLDTVRLCYAFFEARVRQWHGVSWKHRWAILGGHLVAPFHQKKPPFWVWNIALNQLYLSTHHLTAQHTKSFVDAMRRHRANHLVTYPASGKVMADHMLEQSLEAPPLRAVFSNAEGLTPAARDSMTRAFGCPVVDTYGMGEHVLAASECPEGRMHTWPEMGLIEVFDDFEDRPVNDGEAGRLILTGLLNADMPLIRYEVGDRGRLATSDTTCRCGRTLPCLAAIEGRASDLLVTPDGRRIFWLNPTFYGLPVREGQIIQERLDRIEVRVLPAAGFGEADKATIIQRLRERVGEVDIRVNVVDHIPRLASGKFRPVICKLNLSTVSHNG